MAQAYTSPENSPIELHETFTPYIEIQSPEQRLQERRFSFFTGGRLVQGGFQVNVGSPFAFDNTPAIRPFGGNRYRVDILDSQLDLRHDKLAEASFRSLERILDEFGAQEYVDYLVSGKAIFPPRLSLCLFDDNLTGFTPEEQDSLRRIELVVIFDETARIRDAVGSIFFPSDLTGIGGNPRIDSLMRQNALVDPIGKNTKKRIPFGRITHFVPLDAYVAGNDPLTDIVRGTVSPGHPIEMPFDLESVRLTQFRFIEIPPLRSDFAPVKLGGV